MHPRRRIRGGIRRCRYQNRRRPTAVAPRLEQLPQPPDVRRDCGGGIRRNVISPGRFHECIDRDPLVDVDRTFGWTAPIEELFRFHLAQVRELGEYLLGRRLYEAMQVWETDPSLRDNDSGAAFADVWCAIPKIVFSRTLDRVQGNARLAEASVAEEAAAAQGATDKNDRARARRRAAHVPLSGRRR